MNASCDALIIGGGIGGLTVAALLAAQGRRVLLLEASDRLGGFQHRFERDGFAFEPHFHFLQDAGPGRPVREFLCRLGVNVEWVRLEPIALFRFPDRDVVVGNDRQAFIAKLKLEFPDEAAGIDALFEASLAIYHALTRRQPSPLLAQYATDTVEAFAARFVRNGQVKAIISAWSAYFGYGSSRIAALAIIVFTEACWDGGIYQPVGGIGRIVRGLKACIEASQGIVRTGVTVRRVVVEGDRVRSVELADGSVVTADIVVSNADAGTTFHDLLGQEAAAEPARRQIAELRRFRSPFCVYLGVRAEGLDLANGAAVRIAFDGYDLNSQDDAQMRGDIEHAAVSLGVPTRTNPGLAPDGHAIVILYTFVSESTITTLLRDRDAANAYARRLVHQAERLVPGLGEKVVVMETSASATRQLYAPHTHGAIGWEPTPEQLPVLPSNRTGIGGLYLSGQWTQTGAGMNNVFASAQIAASMIAESECHG